MVKKSCTAYRTRHGVAVQAVPGNWYERLRSLPVAGFLYPSGCLLISKNSMEQKVKPCPHCKTEVNAKATRCPHCHGKIFRLTKVSKISLGIIGFVIIIFIIGGSGGTTETTNTPAVTASQTPEIGEEGYLRLPGITDPEQVICLGETEEDYDQINKALIAKDFIGLMEIPGAFCVSNGTKVLVIDSAVFKRRVRILEDVREVDSDKILMSGWTASDWVVAR